MHEKLPNGPKREYLKPSEKVTFTTSQFKDANGKYRLVKTFGRSSEKSQYIILNESVSGAHFEVLVYDFGDHQSFMIKDVGSTNGTSVAGGMGENPQKLLPTQVVPLVHNTIINFGNQTFKVSLGETSGPSPEPTLTLLLV